MVTPLVQPDGAAIQQLRTEKGWSGAMLAEHAGIGRTSVYHIENGRACKPWVLWRIANTLGTTADEITAPGQDRMSA